MRIVAFNTQRNVIPYDLHSCLAETKRADWTAEIAAMILEHHRLRHTDATRIR